METFHLLAHVIGTAKNKLQSRGKLGILFLYVQKGPGSALSETWPNRNLLKVTRAVLWLSLEDFLKPEDVVCISLWPLWASGGDQKAVPITFGGFKGLKMVDLLIHCFWYPRQAKGSAQIPRPYHCSTTWIILKLSKFSAQVLLRWHAKCCPPLPDDVPDSGYNSTQSYEHISSMIIVVFSTF